MSDCYAHPVAQTLRAADWDRLQAMPEPALEFILHDDAGHDVPLSHYRWHTMDRAYCPCGQYVDLVHARRHVSCPCDEVTAPE